MILCTLLAADICSFAQGVVNSRVVEQTGKGGVATLYALDPLAQSFCFRDAGDGHMDYGYEETVGGGQGFASVHFEDGKLVILKDRRTRVMQGLNESTQLFAEPTSSANAPVRLGHIYLARLTDRNDPSFQLLVKLLVIGYKPGESVTFRWQSL
ncbi:MAG: hypothetical protein M3R69_00470 [Acidobacteriota bacterium]|nr:hypothetical protein [Acidobacteriota bacterium]